MFRFVVFRRSLSARVAVRSGGQAPCCGPERCQVRVDIWPISLEAKSSTDGLRWAFDSELYLELVNDTLESGDVELAEVGD